MAATLHRLGKCMAFLPSDQTAAYFEAMRQAPQLVQSESSPAMFLAYENNAIDKAARRLGMYWTKRQQLFGERAFQSMVVEGSGTLAGDDIIALGNKFPENLPKDQQGRAVFYFDLAQADSRKQNSVSNARALFFLLTKATLSDQVVQNGLIVIIGTRDVTAITTDAVVMQFGEFVHHSFPTSVHTAHVVWTNELASEGSNDHMELSIRLLSRTLFSANEKLHKNLDREKLIETFAQHGLKTDRWPASLLGRRKRAASINLAARASHRQQDINVLGGDAKLAPDPGGIGAHTRATGQQTRSVNRGKFSESTEDEIVGAEYLPAGERRRLFEKKRNALYSRRRYHRQKIESGVFKQRASDLEASNERLRRDNLRLENFLVEANWVVSVHTTNTAANVDPSRQVQPETQPGLLSVSAQSEFHPPSVAPDPSDSQAISALRQMLTQAGTPTTSQQMLRADLSTFRNPQRLTAPTYQLPPRTAPIHRHQGHPQSAVAAGQIASGIGQHDSSIAISLQRLHEQPVAPHQDASGSQDTHQAALADLLARLFHAVPQPAMPPQPSVSPHPPPVPLFQPPRADSVLTAAQQAAALIELLPHLSHRNTRPAPPGHVQQPQPLPRSPDPSMSQHLQQGTTVTVDEAQAALAELIRRLHEHVNGNSAGASYP